MSLLQKVFSFGTYKVFKSLSLSSSNFFHQHCYILQHSNFPAPEYAIFSPADQFYCSGEFPIFGNNLKIMGLIQKKKNCSILNKNPFWFALAFPAFTVPSIAFCVDPAPALPDLNEIPVGLSPAEIAQLHRETEENVAQCGRLLQEICGQAKELVVRQAGAQDELTLEKFVDVVRYLADVDELPEEERIPTLIEFRAPINNKDLPIWFHINKEMKRWGDRGLC